MTNNKLKQLTKAIQLANPDIMKLEFGCNVDVGYPTAHYVKVLRVLESNKYSICNYIRNTKYEGMQEIIEYQDNFSVGRTPIKEITEIIGRDITLEDCLIAIGKKSDDFNGWDADSQCNLNYLIKVWIFNIPLHQQEQETIDFLWDLICKE